ncbi:MAG: hypothetical protein V1799_09165 [bacterium]
MMLLVWSSVSAQQVSSARGAALGAFTALANDITSIEWNPAGLNSVRDWEVTASTFATLRRDIPLKGISLFTTGSAKRFLDHHVIAGSYSPGLSMEFVVPSALQFPDGPRVTAEKRITYREQYALGYGYKIAPSVGVGISARFREQLITDTEYFTEQARILTKDFTASGWNLDFGILWNYSPAITVGAVAKNLFRFTETELPQDLLEYGLRNIKSLRMGLAYKYQSDMTLAFDFDTEKQGALGMEWTPSETIALRGSLLYGAKLQPFFPGFGAGIGWSYGSAKFDLSYLYFFNQEARDSITVQQFLTTGVKDLGYNQFTHNQVTLSVNVALGRTRDILAKIENVRISDVYPSSYQDYASWPIGKALVRNISGTPIEATVSFYVDRFMDKPTVTRPYFIEPKAEAEIPFTAVFNEAVTSISSMILKAGEVFVSAAPAEGYDDRFQMNVVFRGRNEWDGNIYTLRNFVTPEDRDVLRFTRGVISKYKDSLAATPKALEKITSAALLFDEFASRLSYVNDPKLSKDRVQFPPETIALRGGDCDDMTVCFSSLLISVGISTAFVDIVPPGKPQDAHIFLLFDTGIPVVESDRVSENPKRYVIRKNEQGKETVWIPLETTAITEGFQKAWEVGAEEYLNTVVIGDGIVRNWVRVVDVIPNN